MIEEIERVLEFQDIFPKEKNFSIEETLKKYNLVQVECVDNKKIYKDILIYKKGYKLTELDKKFITALCDAKRKNF